MTSYATCTADCPVDCDGSCRESAEPTKQDYLEKLKARLMTAAAVKTLPKPEPLIQGVLRMDSYAYMTGAPASFKSFISLDMAGCVGSGENWQGHLTAHGQVLYVVAEGAGGMADRIEAWEQAYGHEMTGVTFLPEAVQAANERQWRALVALVADMKPVLVVLDTQARMTVGLEENSAKDMGAFVDGVGRVLRATGGGCVLVVHHTGRNGDRMRGSSAMDGATDTEIRITRDGDQCEVACFKQKDSAEFDPFRLRAVPTGQSLTFMLTDGSGSTAGNPFLSDWWQAFGSDEVSATTAMETLKLAKSSFYRLLGEYRAKGMIVKTGKKARDPYYMPSAPEASPTNGSGLGPTSHPTGVGLGRTNGDGSSRGPWDSRGTLRPFQDDLWGDDWAQEPAA